MLKLFAFVVSGGLVISLGAATIAAPAQDRPGIVLQPRVIVENRGRNQVIPVSVQEWVTGERPVTVQLSGEPIVQTRRVIQAWAYRSVTVAPGQDMANALAAAGAEGWEATGSQSADASGLTLLLKRPR